MSLALIVVQIAHFAELVLTLLFFLLRSIGFRVRVRVWFLSLQFFLHYRTEASLSERLGNLEKGKTEFEEEEENRVAEFWNSGSGWKIWVQGH